MTFPPSFYGAAAGDCGGRFSVKNTPGVIREIPVPVEGFYSKGFVDKLERERRYGNVYTVEDQGGAFLVRMEFPRLDAGYRHCQAGAIYRTKCRTMITIWSCRMGSYGQRKMHG